MKLSLKTVLLWAISMLMVLALFTSCEKTMGENTPYIGENGNWWIDETDTGKPHRARKVTPEPPAHKVKKATRAIKVTPELLAHKVKKAIRAIRATPERQEPTERRPISVKTATGGLATPTRA